MKKIIGITLLASVLVGMLSLAGCAKDQVVLVTPYVPKTAEGPSQVPDELP